MRDPSPPAPQFATFGIGIVATLGCLLSAAWVLMEPEVAALASCIIISTVYLVLAEARRIFHRFHLQEDEIVSFSEFKEVYPGFPRNHSAPSGFPDAKAQRNSFGTPVKGLKENS